jgi:hypothetical protein
LFWKIEILSLESLKEPFRKIKKNNNNKKKNKQTKMPNFHFKLLSKCGFGLFREEKKK